MLCGRTRQSMPVSSNVASARSSHEQRPPPATCRTPVGAALGDLDERGREVAGVRRAADLVVDDGDLVALGAEPQHRVDEVAAVRAEQPRGADDRGAAARPRRRRARRRASSARRPSAARSAASSAYGSARVAVEDVVGRDVDDERAGLGRRGATLPAPAPLIGGRRGLVGLGAVDVGPGGAVDHRVGLASRDGGAHGVGVGDVEVGPGEGDDLVAGARCGRHDVAAEHARGARDEEAHG